MPSPKQPKRTQGHDKMLLYLEDLVRNKDFKRLAKRVRNTRESKDNPKGTYYDWTPEERKRHDSINDLLSSILNGYESLRKRCNRVMQTPDVIAMTQMAEAYGLDMGLIDLAIAMIRKDPQTLWFAEMLVEPDMCKAVDWHEEMSPYNKGEEIIYLNIRRQLLMTAYPTAIVIHPKASKRDVLDYVEKMWKHIDDIRANGTKPLKIRKRKHDQKMLDFIWENQGLSARQVKKRLDEKFPNNGLVYYEINKIIQLEKERRYGNLT